MLNLHKTVYTFLNKILYIIAREYIFYSLKKLTIILLVSDTPEKLKSTFFIVHKN